MFKLDDKFLQDIGLNDLPEVQKKPFLQHIYDELELRVGTRLSDGLSDEQLEEFESIIDHKEEIIITWLAKYVPKYRDDQVFIKLKDPVKLDDNDPKLIAEYAATKWLEVNRPDYKQVVTAVLGEIKQEVINNRDVILGDAKV